jgi:uncharacterized iron-regulated membrane protein
LKRRALVRVHLWFGLIIGLLWSLQGLTGAALVFHREIDRWSIAAPPHGPMASLNRIVAVAESHTGAKVASVGIADSRGDLVNVQYEAGGPRQLQVDAATARVVRERDYDPSTPFEGSAWRWVYLLHESLLLHDRGEALIGISGMFLLSSLILGLVIGWPQRGRWAQAFGWRRWRSTRAKLFGWHRMAGLIAGAAMLFTVPGGIWMAFASDVRPVLARVTDFRLPYESEPVEELGSVIGPQDALERARKVFPDAQFVRLTMPSAKAPIYVARMKRPDEVRAWSGVTTVTLDATNGQVLHTYDAVRAPLANRITDAAFSIHSGEIGGVAGRILIVLVGLSLPALYVTGIWAWWRKRKIS